MIGCRADTEATETMTSDPSQTEIEELRRRVRELERRAAATERQRELAQAELLESEERYRTLYENIPLMYFTLDAEGTVRSVNAHGASELGYVPEELIGRSVLGVFHPDDRKAVADQLGSVLESPQRVARWTFRKIRKDGTLLWVHEAVRVARASDGEVIVLVVCEDITESRLVEEKLRRQRSQLQDLTAELTLTEERERRRIARDLHDEVGQSLAILRVKIGELGMGRSGDVEPAYEEVRELIEEVLTSTRSLTFELGLPILYELGLGAALESLAEQMKLQHGLEVHFEDDGQGKHVPSETEVVLFRVVRELLLNVVKHADASRAELSLGRKGDRIQITVSDEGVGFDPGEVATRAADSGTFGLFNARERLEYLGGSLEIETGPGEGTRVVLTAQLEDGDDAVP